MMTDDARQLALVHSASLAPSSVKELLENAEKIYDWLQGNQIKPISGCTTYRGTVTPQGESLT